MIKSAKEAREMLRDRRYQHYLHEDCAYKGYLAALEGPEVQGLLDALDKAQDMITGEYCSHSPKHAGNQKSCYADFIFQAREKFQQFREGK